MGHIIDISHHQPSNKFNWEKAAKEVELMVIRVQYGSRVIDREYKNHVANCKKYGIPFGHYAYGHFVSIDDAKKEAQDFLNRIDKDAKFLVLDTENDTIDSCGTKNVAEASQAFIDVCKNAGYKTGFYVSHHLYPLYGLDKVKADFLWIPSYGKNNGTVEGSNKPDYPCCLWQFTDKGKLGWFGSTLDLNLLHGDKTLEWFLGEEKKISPSPTPSQPIPPVFVHNNEVIQRVRAKVTTDIRKAPDHRAEFVRDAHVGEEFNVFARQGDWHNVGQDNWIDGNGGKNLHWIKDDQPSPAYPNVVIKEGSKGEYVKMVQRVVGVKDDGVFGSITKAKVKTWQANHGLVADGIVGKNTWSKMF